MRDSFERNWPFRYSGVPTMNTELYEIMHAEHEYVSQRDHFQLASQYLAIARQEIVRAGDLIGRDAIDALIARCNQYS